MTYSQGRHRSGGGGGGGSDFFGGGAGGGGGGHGGGRPSGAVGLFGRMTFMWKSGQSIATSAQKHTTNGGLVRKSRPNVGNLCNLPR